MKEYTFNSNGKLEHIADSGVWFNRDDIEGFLRHWREHWRKCIIDQCGQDPYKPIDYSKLNDSGKVNVSRHEGCMLMIDLLLKELKVG